MAYLAAPRPIKRLQQSHSCKQIPESGMFPSRNQDTSWGIAWNLTLYCKYCSIQAYTQVVGAQINQEQVRISNERRDCNRIIIRDLMVKLPSHLFKVPQDSNIVQQKDNTTRCTCFIWSNCHIKVTLTTSTSSTHLALLYSQRTSEGIGIFSISLQFKLSFFVSCYCDLDNFPLLKWSEFDVCSRTSSLSWNICPWHGSIYFVLVCKIRLILKSRMYLENILWFSPPFICSCSLNHPCF